MALETARNFASILAADRFIKIFVADITEPYLIPQSTLQRASDYFVKAIKNEHLGQDDIGVLRFPEDDKDAWLFLLQWIVCRELPAFMEENEKCEWIGKEEHEKNLNALIHYWILADKYLMPQLQDFIMLKMLSCVERIEVPTLANVKLAFEISSQGSILRTLFAECLINGDIQGHISLTNDDGVMEDIGSITGALLDILRTRNSFDDDDYNYCYDRLGLDDMDSDGTGKRWLEFMVGEPELGDETFRCRKQVLAVGRG